MKQLSQMLLQFIALSGLLAITTPVLAAPEDEKQVLATLESMVQAAAKRDVAALDKIFHKDVVYIHTSSLTEHKADLLRMAAVRPTFHIKFINPIIRFYGPVALVHTTQEMTLIDDPTKVTVVNAIYSLVKDGRWQILSRQVTLGAPTKDDPQK